MLKKITELETSMDDVTKMPTQVFPDFVPLSLEKLTILGQDSMERILEYWGEAEAHLPSTSCHRDQDTLC